MDVVYISGVWDLFHIGHLNVLRWAAEIGHKLIVGVVTDELASTYKDPPIVSYAQRRLIVSCIDNVYTTVEVNCLGYLPEGLGITIRAHGPEHGLYPQQIQAMSKWAEMGIRGVCLPRTPNISTTLIKERIINENSNKNHCASVATSTCCMCQGEPSDLCGHPVRGRSNDQNPVATSHGLSLPGNG